MAIPLSGWLLTIWGCCLLSTLFGTAWEVKLHLPLLKEADRATVPLPEATVSVHLFEWTWNDVAQECEQYLAPAGFRSVQVSPPQEHILVPEQGFPWWQRYQPVSYQLVSRGGDRAQFANMVRRCQQVGVAVYVDAVINHMAAIDTAPGSAGTVFRRYEYPGLYTDIDFHLCRENITDYQNLNQVTQCELVGLPDLNTARPQVQATLAAYLADLVSLGVDGFRIDAAKHIRSEDLAGILAALRDRISPAVYDDLYFYQEVIDPGTEAVNKRNYYSLGDVIEFEYGRVVSEAFLNQGDRTLADLQFVGLGEPWVPSQKAVVFIDNHDKQRGHGGGGTYLTYKDGRLYTLAMIFMLAHPYGKPRIMSSFRFENADQGPPSDAQGRTLTVHAPDFLGCGEAWICEHRQPEVAAMIGFRAATQTVPKVTDWWSNGRNQIAFGRGDRGFIVINNEATPLLNYEFQTQLPAGQYCEALRQATAPDPSGDCVLPITVDRAGRFRATVESGTAIALYRPSPPMAQGWTTVSAD